jgi:HlyD family secretion protein
MSTRRNKRRTGWIILLCVVIVLAGGLLVVGRMILNSRANNLANIRSIKVQTGTIDKTVTGTGNLKLEETLEDITVLDGLTVGQVLAEPGDAVNQGDMLATFDADNLQTAIHDAQSSLASLDRQLNVLKGNKESIYLTTSISGRIKQIFIAPDESIEAVMAGSGALMILSLDGKMRLDFKPAAIQGLQAGDPVTVRLADDSQLAGTIVSLTSDSCSVTVPDTTAAPGAAARVFREDESPLGEGFLAINQPLAIMGTTGIADSILKDVNSSVPAGTRLIRLKEAAISWDYQNIYESRLTWASRLDTLIRYSVDGGLAAPVSGIVRQVVLAAGSQTGTSAGLGTGSMASGSAADHQSKAFTFGFDQQMKLSVQIDELDIALLSLQQPATVTIDALPDLKPAGTISAIADQGNENPGGSTSYAVTVDLPANSSMREGMTATAVIVVEHRENVVRLPLEALQESGNEQFVYVGTPVSATDLGEKRIVTTGISDGQYVEIKSGLAAGEQVNYLYDNGSSSLLPFGRIFNRPRATTTAGNSSSSLN